MNFRLVAFSVGDPLPVLSEKNTILPFLPISW
jgi:hypothetical protein